MTQPLVQSQSPMSSISMSLKLYFDMWGATKTKMGDLCEVPGCGRPMIIVLKRRIGTYQSGQKAWWTDRDNDAPEHPRCSRHCSTDSWKLDGMTPREAVPPAERP